MIRRWSDFVYAVYVDDGMFGRRVGLVDVREEAENVAPQSLRGEDSSASNNGTMTGNAAQRERVNAPPDDLNPDPVQSRKRGPGVSMPTTPDSPPEGLAESCLNLLALTMDGHADAAADLMADVVEQHGDRGLFSLCYAMAEVVKKVTFKTEGFAHIETLDGRAPEDLSPDSRADLWAARFVTAHLNGDGPMRVALWGAEPSADRRVCNVAALVAMAAALANQAAG